MPDTSAISPFKASCSGGLTLNKDVFAMHPGEALQLSNFEPDITGGYRRLNGTTKFNSNIVPQVSEATERVMFCAIFNDIVVAGRGGTVYTGTTSGSWTSRATSKGTTYTYDFDKFNYAGTDKIIIATGAAAAFTLDTSYTEDIINATGGGTAPTNPRFVKSFANHMFYAGMSNSKAEVIFSAPFAEDDFTSGNGAGSFKIGTEVTGMKVFRDELFIFGESSIYKLAGTSSSNFALAEVAKNVGTLAHHSIQEIGGDIIFLAADGIRTIAGTARIGDVELGTVSKQVQDRINEIKYDNVTATVIRNKSQYRLFYPVTGGLEASQKGLIAVIKVNPNTNQMGYEYSDIKGLKAACCDSELISNVETTISGGYDGYIYKQDSGNVWTRAGGTTNIDATYRSPDITMGDPGIRKTMQRVNLNWKPEGAVSASLFVRYNYDDVNTPQPNVFTLSTSGSGAAYGVGVFGTAAYGQGDLPITRQTVEGSGFAVAVKITDTSSNIPFSIKGFQLEFTPGGRA
tara:strand:+ start:7260 stop:8804 length:1545 start_codon:yes stop_codon:yes gene_type:complete